MLSPNGLRRRDDSPSLCLPEMSKMGGVAALCLMPLLFVCSGCQESGPLLRFTLEVDHSQTEVNAQDEVSDSLQDVLSIRLSEFGIRRAEWRTQDDGRLSVELRTSADPDRVVRLLESNAVLEFSIVDMEERFREALPAIDSALAEAGVTAESGHSASTPSPIEQLLGNDSPDTVVAADGATPLTSHLFDGQIPGEFLVEEDVYQEVDAILQLDVIKEALPAGLELAWGSEMVSQASREFRQLYALENPPILTGDHIEDATANFDPEYRTTLVMFELTRTGGDIFSEETARHIEDYLAIVLDGRVQRQPPIIRSRIGRNGQIELGNAPLQEAQDLALVLRSGALPAPVRVLAVDSILP